MTTEQPPKPPTPPQPQEDPLEPYHAVAETVGLVPSLRLKDNVVQALAVAGGVVLGAIAGLVTHLIVKPRLPMWVLPVGIAVGGAILATFISGFVLMILGFVRQRKRKQGGPPSP